MKIGIVQDLRTGEVREFVKTGTGEYWGPVLKESELAQGVVWRLKTLSDALRHDFCPEDWWDKIPSDCSPTDVLDICVRYDGNCRACERIEGDEGCPCKS